MHATMLRGIRAPVVDTASGNNRNVAILTHVKIIVDYLAKSALRENYRNMQTLVLSSRLDVDINSGLIGLLHDLDVLRRVFSVKASVYAQGVRTLRDLMKSRYLFK